MSRTRNSEPARQRGFTLTELAVVMIIVGLLIGGLVSSYSTMVSAGRYSDAQNTLNTARDALLGFAAANGRLPCPATDGVTYGSTNSYGAEWPLGGLPKCDVATATMPGLGYVPAATLGLTPVDSEGFLIDPWNNRVLYAVSSNGATYDFTTPGALRAALIDLSASTPSPNLRICSTTPITNANTANADCANIGQTLTIIAAAVLISTGPNGATGGTGADEAQNLRSPALPAPAKPWPKDRVYISHTPVPAGTTSAGGEFDDIVSWVSPALVYNRIMSGGI